MMSKGNESKSSSSSPRLDCDVGLGLKMHPSDSYYCDGGGFNLYGFHNNTAFRAGGMVGVCGKALFTASQWQELERQKMILKYIMASIPVPPQLLLPTPSRSPPPPPPLSQCNTSSGLDLRFSTDPEPWRCKRTDGKKWRCSRDVAPDLKYCERHAHKSRPRSRKLVEISSHKSSASSHYPSLSPASSYDQTRCIEWFMKGGSVTNSVSTNKNKNTTFHHSNFEDKQNGFMTLNPYIPDTTNLHHNDPNPILDDPKMKSLTTQTTTTRHFIDAWEKEGYEGMSTKFPISPSSSSLSLSMCGGKGDLGIGMMNSDRESEGVLKPQWMMNSPPGGPLGEALCLGNATTMRGSLGNSSLAPPQGYGYCNTNPNTNTNTNSTNTISSSICSKRCCEDGSYALNFIGDR